MAATCCAGAVRRWRRRCIATRTIGAGPGLHALGDALPAEVRPFHDATNFINFESCASLPTGVTKERHDDDTTTALDGGDAEFREARRQDVLAVRL